MAKIAERIERLKGTINSYCARVGRDICEIKLVVVTKSAPIQAVKEVIHGGFTDLGENRVQQLRKVSAQMADFLKEADGNPALPEKINWHMIGHLQRNKVPGAAHCLSNPFCRYTSAGRRDKRLGGKIKFTAQSPPAG